MPEVEASEEVTKKQKLKERILQALDLAQKHYEENLYSKEAVKAQVHKARINRL